MFSPSTSDKPKLFFEDIYNPSKKAITVSSPSGKPFTKLFSAKKLSDSISITLIQDLKKQIDQAGFADVNSLPP